MGANQVGRNHAGLRRRMGLFARLRSARRALPAAASDLARAEEQEAHAARLRERLAALAAQEAPAKELAKDLNAALVDVDTQLDTMQQALFAHFDETPFVSLRAKIPGSVESHRPEVIALLETLIGDRDHLLERLPRVEYLITMLATDEEDGRRNIKHDPVTLTPALENFTVEELEPVEAEAIAMELYQAASLDPESDDFHSTLRELRTRKQHIGLGCLCPSVLRAVVTYNARMFNSVESMAEASREKDSILDDSLLQMDEPLETSDEPGPEDFVSLEIDTEPVADVEPEAPVDEVPAAAAAPVSAFDSEALGSVIDTLRMRLEGGRVGRRGPSERIAIVLDQASLTTLEKQAICADDPTSDQKLVARTTVVGLMLRDLGPIQDSIDALGISRSQLTDAWVRELNESFGQLISGKLADPKGYDLASQLSGIKAKHLLKPFNALNNAKRGGPTVSAPVDAGSAEMRKVARAAASGAESLGGVRTIRIREGGASSSLIGDGSRAKLIAAVALVAIAAGLAFSNIVGFTPAELRDVQAGSLSITSPHLESAYRNEKGRGPVMIGRVDHAFQALPIDEKIEVAEEMIENFEIQGITEAIFYDARGMMQVHYVDGKLNRPRPGDRSTGRAPGEASVRRSLSGERLDEMPDADGGAETDSSDDPWGDL